MPENDTACSSVCARNPVNITPSVMAARYRTPRIRLFSRLIPTIRTAPACPAKSLLSHAHGSRNDPACGASLPEQEERARTPACMCACFRKDWRPCRWSCCACPNCSIFRHSESWRMGYYHRRRRAPLNLTVGGTARQNRAHSCATDGLFFIVINMYRLSTGASVPERPSRY